MITFNLRAVFLFVVRKEAKKIPPGFLCLIPIRKTRAGLQFTCAAPTLGINAHKLKDVWVCNSDGYVGQVSQGERRRDQMNGNRGFRQN